MIVNINTFKVCMNSYITGILVVFVVIYSASLYFASAHSYQRPGGCMYCTAPGLLSDNDLPE
jgi:hypothetical protein